MSPSTLFARLIRTLSTFPTRFSSRSSLNPPSPLEPPSLLNPPNSLDRPSLLGLLLPLVLLLLLSSYPASAAPASSRGGKGGKPIDITSNILTFNSHTRVAVAEGAVWARSEDFTLRSRKATAFYGKGRQIERLEARGKVVIVRRLDGLKVEGEEADFDRGSGVAVVRGSPVATRPTGDVLEGELMTLYLNDDRLETTQPRLFLTQTAEREAVNIVGEWMESADKGALTVFERNVVLRQGDLVAKGDRLDGISEDESDSPEPGTPRSVDRKDPREGKAVNPKKAASKGVEPQGSSSGAESDELQIKTLILTGNVDVLRGPQRARAARGEYDPVTEDLILEGSPVVTEGENVIRGERIVMDGATGVAKVTRARVRVRAE